MFNDIQTIVMVAAMAVFSFAAIKWVNAEWAVIKSKFVRKPRPKPKILYSPEAGAVAMDGRYMEQIAGPETCIAIWTAVDADMRAGRIAMADAAETEPADVMSEVPGHPHAVMQAAPAAANPAAAAGPPPARQRATRSRAASVR